jgi:hypothetical protein
MSQTLDPSVVTEPTQGDIGKRILESISCRVEPKKEVLQSFVADCHSAVSSVTVKLGSLLPTNLPAEDLLYWLKLIAVNFGWSNAAASEFSYTEPNWPNLDASVAHKANEEILTKYILQEVGLHDNDSLKNDSLKTIRDLLRLDLVVSIVYDNRKLYVTDKTDLAIALAKQLLTQKTTEVVAAGLFTADGGHVTTQLVWMDYVNQSIDAKSCAITSRVCCGQIKLIGYIPAYPDPP